MTIQRATPVAAQVGGGPHAIPLRVLIIAENASYRFGGEAVLPLHYFRRLRARGVPVWMITNARCQAELSEKLTEEEMSLIRFIPDGRLHKWLGKVARWLPQSVASFTVGQIIEMVDQYRARKVARKMITYNAITVVHQPTPVSPKHISVIEKVGVPVVMGPMNGGITYPQCFRRREQGFDRVFVPLGRCAANVVHRVFTGKRNAAALLVANQRTAEALPKGVKGQVHHVVENGVDLAVYRGAARGESRGEDGVVKFAFAGRLVGWKGVDLLLEAVARARLKVDLRLEVLGEGPCRGALEAQARALGISDVVTFHGWLSHAACAEVLGGADVFVLPSLRECGGAVVLEAMAMKLPVIATGWGGPADYVDESCGVLVPPLSQEQFVQDLGEALVRMARHPEMREAMGEAGYAKVAGHYDWERKVGEVVGVYREVLGAWATLQR